MVSPVGEAHIGLGVMAGSIFAAIIIKNKTKRPFKTLMNQQHYHNWQDLDQTFQNFPGRVVILGWIEGFFHENLILPVQQSKDSK